MLIILEFREWDVVSLNYDQGVDRLVPPGALRESISRLFQTL